ncbi:MAG TPA: carbohydrate ABC transporter permease [Candidatus Limnocylindria bacterium]|nr:carbohydrate ABC transporter permease [Candidatus Limnocylindria bacterium]
MSATGNKGKAALRARSMRVMNLHLPSHAALILWSLVVLFPLWVMIMGSFKDRRSIYTNTFGLPAVWNTANYTDILQSSDFLRYFLNSFMVVALSLILVMAAGALAAYALSNWRGKLSSVMFFFLIAGMMLPIRIGSIKLLEIVKGLGLMGSKWALVPIYTGMGIPMSVFVLTGFMRRTPHELIEAGYMDGAGYLRIFSTIVLPLMRPALATVAIYNLVPFWNDLWFPLIIITEESEKTLLLGVTRLFGQYQTDWSKVLAVLTLSAVPVITLYLLMSRQFIAGLTAGAVKG